MSRGQRNILRTLAEEYRDRAFMAKEQGNVSKGYYLEERAEKITKVLKRGII